MYCDRSIQLASCAVRWGLAALIVLLAAGGTAPRLAAQSPASDAFQAEFAALAKTAADAGVMAVAGRDGWLFLGSELRHVAAGPFWGEAAGRVSRAKRPEAADPLPAILDFKSQLDRAGIELLLVPVPPKVVVYPDKLSVPLAESFGDDLPRLDLPHQEFYRLLAERGVDVLDLTQVFLAGRDHPELGPVYCQQDTHWSGAGCVVAAQHIAAPIRDRAWLAESPEIRPESRIDSVEVVGDLARDGGAGPAPRETLKLRFISIEGQGRRPVPTSPDSPIILLGDSHNLVFHAGGADMHAAGAGLADQLALELKRPIDVVAVRGSGATPARVNLLRNSRRDGYLQRKKLVIWCFAAREFTEADGWQMVPIVK